jgi:hypothetical protein
MTHDIMNEWAIRYFENGLTSIPMNTNENKPMVKLSQYTDNPPSRQVIEEWITKGLYKYGLALVCGRCQRGKFKGLYLNCLDIDELSILNKLLEMFSLEELSKNGIFVEQHDKARAHLWIFSTRPFPKLHREGIEVKSNGLWCNIFPSINKDGHRYMPVGDSLKIFQDGVDPVQSDGFVNVIDKILDGNYLNGKAKKNTSKVSIEEKWRQGTRNNNLFDYARDTLTVNRDTTPLEVIRTMVHEMNKVQCDPPLAYDEVENIINSAQNYSTTKKTQSEVDSGESEDKKQSKIRVAFETVRQQIKNLFIDEYQIPHIAIPIEDHLEVLPVNSNVFKNWYRMFIFDRDKVVLENQTINDLCSLASAYAASHKYGTQINLNLRTALRYNFKTQWVYDLVNKDWEFIKITSNGWDIFKDEVIFRIF